MYGKVFKATFGEARELLDCSMNSVKKTGHFYYINRPILKDKDTNEIFYGIYEDEKYVWCICNNGISKKLNLKNKMINVGGEK